MVRRPNLPSLLLAPLAALALASCTPAAPQESPTEDPAAIFSEALAQAREGGASPAQVAVLETAADAGDLPVETAREATRRTLDCFASSGIDAEYTEEKRPWGLILPGYQAATETSESETALDACVKRESYWVSMVYQTQPSSMRLLHNYAEQQSDILRDCLKRNGYDPPADATGVELGDQASKVAYETHGRVACLAEAGITAW